MAGKKAEEQNTTKKEVVFLEIKNMAEIETEDEDTFWTQSRRM